MFRSLLKEQEDLAWAPAPFAVLEMAAVRLATLPAGDDVAKLLARIDALERRLAGGGPGPASGPNGGPAGGQTPQGGGGARRGSHGTKSASAAADGAEAAAAQRAPEPGAPLPVVFDRLRGFAGKRSPGLFAALEGGHLMECGEDRLRIAIPQRFSAQRLGDRLEALEALCSELFGRTLKVEIECEEDGSAPDGAAARDPESVRRLRQDALNDPGVLTALEILEGEIVEIRPLGPGGGDLS